jgi:hypothetical protein
MCRLIVHITPIKMIPSTIILLSILYIMDNKNLFFDLGSILIIIILLSLIGILDHPHKKLIVNKSTNISPVYHNPHVSKNILYTPYHHVSSNPYKLQYYN